MCGIGGVLFSQKPEKQIEELLLEIERNQIHRGPDEQNIWIKNKQGLCHQRLSIIDIKNGQQPMRSTSDRYVLTFNGELYNYSELRKKLSSQYTFKTSCDSELILAAYIVWNKKCVNQFIGMFSFLIWDKITETGFAARDLLGVKPFVYSYIDGEFIFASEVKTLVAILPKKLSLNEYSFAETIIAPSLSGVTDSLFKEISILQAGTYLEISCNGIKETNYSFEHTNTSFYSEKECIQEFRSEFEKSVSYALTSDIEIGCFLSGGLDSSYIVAQAQKLQSGRFKTYEIVFDKHDEIEFSSETIVCSNDNYFTNLMKQEYSLQHKEILATRHNIISEIEQITINNDRISAWEQEISQHFLSKYVSKELKAVLVGDAADEMNYGYFFLLNQDIDKSPMGISNLFGGKERFNLLNPEFSKQKGFYDYLYAKYETIAHDAGCRFDKGKEERLRATSSLINKLWLGRLLHNGDIHTMNSSLEARVPFANQNLCEVSKRIHQSLGFKNNVEKYIVRESAKGILIDDIRLRKKSALPRDPRLGKAYQKILHNLLHEKNSFCEEYLNIKYLKKLAVDNHLTEQKRMVIFNSISTIYWSKKYYQN